MGRLGTTILVFVLAHGLPVAQALAQDATQSTAARALFNEGVAFAEQEQWIDAAERFERAIVLRDSAVIAFNLALALEHLGRPVEAAERFRRVARDAASDASMRAMAQTGLDEVEPTIAWVTVSFVGDVSGHTLTLDGHDVPTALVGVATPVDPGAHTFALRDEGGSELVARPLTLAPGEHATTTIEVPIVATPVDVAPVLALPPPAPPPANDDTWLWVGIGAGAAVVVAAIVVTIVLVSTPSDAAAWSGNAGVIEVGR